MPLMLLLLLLYCTKASQMFGRTNHHKVRMIMMTVTSDVVRDFRPPAISIELTCGVVVVMVQNPAPGMIREQFLQ
jgi:hypothetical protein